MTPDQAFNSMNNHYELARQEFDPVFYLIGLCLFLFLFWFINRDSKPPKKTEDDPRNTIITKDQLRQYDGTGPVGTIWIACNELVFDVTQSDNYKAGGMYEKFAGRDITIACANYSTDEKYLDQDWHPDMRLSFSQEQNIQQFYISFC